MYKFMMSISAFLDSVITTQPFKNIQKDLLKGYTVSEVIEPMLFNNYIPDNKASFDFTKEPAARLETPVYKSYAGEIMMLLLTVLLIPLSKVLAIFAPLTLSALTLRKNLKQKKDRVQPERY